MCVLVALADDGRELVAEGALEGSIARRRAGDEGFGFDPVFVPDGETRTVAELGDDWKTRTLAPRPRRGGARPAALGRSRASTPGACSGTARPVTP